jgi:thioredoxin reductase (NADPH)
LIGAGVHFCATCDGPFYRGAPNLVVIGGGNAGLEEGLFLTQFSDRVTVIQSLPVLTASRALQDKVAAHPNIDVILEASLTSFDADKDGRLAGVTVMVGGDTRKIAAPGAFVFVGLDPNTKFIANSLDLDERGFVLTDHLFRSSLDGVFAAGDVRSGSTKQIASAVGDGAAVALQIRYFLDEVADRSKMPTL